MLEKRIEKRLSQEINKLGGKAIKFVSPSMNSLPDRIIFMPGGRTYFIELKKPGKKPSKKQLFIFDIFRELGFYCEYIDTLEKVKKFIHELRTTQVSGSRDNPYPKSFVLRTISGHGTGQDGGNADGDM